MKVNNVKNTIYNPKPAASKAAVRNLNAPASALPSAAPFEPSFKGLFKGFDLTQILIDIFAAIARGGLAASFTVQDMFGTNFPRTGAALSRNKDLTGKNNYKAAVEVAIREFTTGPSMFVIPALVLAGAGRFSGEANKVPAENIADLSEVMKKTVSNLSSGEFKGVDFKNMTSEEALDACKQLKKSFYKEMFKGIFEQYGAGEGKVDIDEYVRLMMKAEDAKTPKRNFFMSMAQKKVKVLGKEVDSKDEVLAQISDKFVRDKKAISSGWGNFLSAKILPQSKKATGILDIIDDAKNFSNDFAKTNVSSKRSAPIDSRILANKFIDNFRDKRIGSRFLTSTMMVVATGIFMCFIPKLYTRNKTNPETDAIYAHVNEQRKGALNADK